MSRRSFATLSLSLLLLAGGIRCTSQESRLDDLEASARIRRVHVFMIEKGVPADGERRVGCGDRAVPVIVTLDTARPALYGALEALLGNRRPHDPGSGLSNPLYASRLALDRIERKGASVKVFLSGYVEVDGACDPPRLLAQLSETVLQFRDVQHVQLYLEGKPLQELLRGVGAVGATGVP